MNDTFSFDVFLSHNRADKPRVHRLADRLKAKGLRVWLDDWVVKPGDDIFLAVEQGLQAARVLVLCMSPDALGSGWVGLERSTVLFRDPSNAGRRFIPLLLTDCVLPDTLRRYKHVDYREETNVAFAELLAACLGAEGPRPEDSAVAPGKPKGVRKIPVNRCAYDENPELVFSDDDFRIANKYTADEISESQCDLIIKQLSESLAERGWRLHGMERGPRAWGCTSPAFNLALLCDSPAIMLNILDERWYAYEHCPKNLRTYVIAQIKEAKSDFKNDAKIRIASDFIENNSNLVDIQETDYLSPDHAPREAFSH
jgi:TIR domain-containing protein